MGMVTIIILLLAVMDAYKQTQPAREERRAQEEEDRHRQLVDEIKSRWEREGRVIHFPPVLARYYGDGPDRVNTLNPDRGVLGVVDHRLLFVGMSSAGFEIGIPLSTIRWISQTGAQAVEHNALTIYREVSGEWRLDLWATDQETELIQAIQQIASVPISTQVDHGPIPALRARQNLLGQWERDHTVSLYLAPDRLLADWHSAVPLDAIRGLAVLPAAGLQFNDAALLRIGYADLDGRPQTVGFELSSSQAQAWAEILSRRTGISIDYESGRKKKEDE
jgi:hypothetical protein